MVRNVTGSGCCLQWYTSANIIYVYPKSLRKKVPPVYLQHPLTVRSEVWTTGGGAQVVNVNAGG